jgi:hypothetical protein
MTIRISAELDDEHLSKLVYIQQTTNQETVAVIQSAIDLYYQQLQDEQPTPFNLLEQTGFIGCGEADPNLSVNYKSLLKDRLSSKYDHR